MKQKKLIIILAAVLAVLIIGGIIFFVISNKSSQQAQPVAQENKTVPTLQPDDIGLSLSPVTTGKFAGFGVDMKITKLDGIVSIDYELAYLANDLPRGAIGHIDTKPGDSSIDQPLAFGTCSDVCHPDSGVHDVKLTLRVTKNDGKDYQVSATYDVPQK